MKDMPYRFACKGMLRTIFGLYGRLPAKEAGRKYKRLSIVGRRADALALGADERRDKLRKAAGSCT